MDVNWPAWVDSFKDWLPSWNWWKWIKIGFWIFVTIIVIYCAWQAFLCMAWCKVRSTKWQNKLPGIYKGSPESALPSVAPSIAGSTAALVPAQRGNRLRRSLRDFFHRDGSDQPFATPAVLKLLRHRYRQEIETANNLDILHDEDEAPADRRTRRLQQAQTSASAVGHAINKSRTYVLAMPVAELEAAIQRWRDSDSLQETDATKDAEGTTLASRLRAACDQFTRGRGASPPSYSASPYQEPRDMMEMIGHPSQEQDLPANPTAPTVDPTAPAAVESTHV